VQYAAIGADIGAAATATGTNNLALLNDIVGASQSSDVDSVAKLNDLARIANAIQTTAAGGTPSQALSVADLSKAGLTGVTTDNLAAVLRDHAVMIDEINNSLDDLRAFIDWVNGTYPDIMTQYKAIKDIQESANV
jgi:hypothetical protein